MLASKTLPPRALLRELLDYNPVSGEFIWRRRPREMFSSHTSFMAWNGRYAGNPAGYFKKHGYLYIAIASTKYLAHRFAWLIHHGDPVPAGIDHANGDSWDNRIANLRAATQSQNIFNARRSKRSNTGAKGVFRANQRQEGFCARIDFEGKHVNLGTFATVEEASRAYQDAATRLYGEFARHD